MASRRSSVVAEVTEGQTVAAPHASTKLIELREAEPFSMIYQYCITCRNINTIFYDGGRQQHVVFAIDERQHRAFELALLHLTVPDDHAQTRHDLLEILLHAVDRFDAVVDEEALAAAAALESNRLRDEILVERHDRRLNRETVFGRRFDDRDVANADQRHVQSPRNRSR